MFSKKKRGAQFWICLCIAVLLGAVFMGYMGNLSVRLFDRISYGALLVWIVGLPLGIWLAFQFQIVVHEAGHLLFGLLSGYRFRSFRVRNLMWLWRDGKIHFGRYALAGTAGGCQMSPPELVNGRMPVVLFYMGGAILNLLVGLLLATLWFPRRDQPFLSMLLLIPAGVGVYLALFNGIPDHGRLVDNDGRCALSLRRNPEALRALWIRMRMGDLLIEGKGLFDLPEEWCAMPSDDALRNPIIAPLGILACLRLYYAGRREEADAAAEKLLQGAQLAGMQRAVLLCEQMYWEMVHENRPEVVEALYTAELRQLMKSMETHPTVLRTRYAYELLVKQNPGWASKYKCEFDQIAQGYPYPGDIEFERKLMELAQQRARNES